MAYLWLIWWPSIHQYICILCRTLELRVRMRAWKHPSQLKFNAYQVWVVHWAGLSFQYLRIALWVIYLQCSSVTTSACGRTAVRSGPLFMRPGVALCPPRCVFHSWLLFLWRLRQLSPCKTPAPFLGTVLVRLVLWVSRFSVPASPFPTPSLWIRGWARHYVLQPIRPPFLVLSFRILPTCYCLGTYPAPCGNGDCSYLR